MNPVHPHASMADFVSTYEGAIYPHLKRGDILTALPAILCVEMRAREIRDVSAMMAECAPGTYANYLLAVDDLNAIVHAKQQDNPRVVENLKYSADRRVNGLEILLQSRRDMKNPK